MKLSRRLFLNCYPRSIVGAKFFDKSDLLGIQSPIGSFWVNLNHTGQDWDLSRVEAFSYDQSVARLSAMVDDEPGEVKSKVTKMITDITKRTIDLKEPVVPPGKVLIVSVDTQSLGNVIEAAQQCEDTSPIFDSNPS